MTLGKQHVVVSDEMLAFWGPGSISRDLWPRESAALAYSGIDGPIPRVSYAPRASSLEYDDADVVFVVQRAACNRLFDTVPSRAGAWHMPSALRVLVLSIRDCDGPAGASGTLRLARSIELLCQTFSDFAQGELIPCDGQQPLGELDAAKIAAARRLVDERWREKHTLVSIARACGLNRDKLSRGFRAAYRTTVADALAERRLEGARSMLVSSDLPVGAVGYRCGYLNKASFTRAFVRHFGYPPSELRRQRSAAS